MHKIKLTYETKSLENINSVLKKLEEKIRIGDVRVSDPHLTSFSFDIQEDYGYSTSFIILECKSEKDIALIKLSLESDIRYETL